MKNHGHIHGIWYVAALEGDVLSNRLKSPVEVENGFIGIVPVAGIYIGNGQ